MQLQIALALSKEECEKEKELRRGDEIRLQVCEILLALIKLQLKLCISRPLMLYIFVLKLF